MSVQTKFRILVAINWLWVIAGPLTVFTGHYRLRSRKIGYFDNFRLGREYATFKLFHDINTLMKEGHCFDVYRSRGNYHMMFGYGDVILKVWTANKPYADMDLFIYRESHDPKCENKIVTNERPNTPSFALAWYMRRTIKSIKKREATCNVPCLLCETNVDLSCSEVDRLYAAERLKSL